MAEGITEGQAERAHFFKDDIAWSGSGRPGDPWAMLSWEVRRCTCERPWRHAHPA